MKVASSNLAAPISVFGSHGPGGVESALSAYPLRDSMPSWQVRDVLPPEPGHAIRVTVEGKPVAVFNVGSGLVAIDARCTHVGGPLDRGPVTGGTVTCPLHGSQFDLASGQVVRGPATQPVRAYRVRADTGGLVLESD